MTNISDGSVWDSGTWSAAESTGHYMFLKATNVPEGATVKVQVLNGTHGPTTLDSDLNIVLRIANKDTQKIKIVSMIDSFVDTKVYTIKGLTLAD